MATRKPYSRSELYARLSELASQLSKLDDDVHQRGVLGAKTYEFGSVSKRLKMRKHSRFLLDLNGITNRIDQYLKNIYHIASGISKPGEYK